MPLNWPLKHQKKSIIKDVKTGQEYTLKTPRYGAKRRKYCRGACGLNRPHDSGEEASYCVKLGILKKVGEIKNYRSQVTYPLSDRSGKSCGNMRVDFEITRPDGSIYIAEYKGKLFGTLREFHLARALFSHCYPETEYLTVTEKDLI